MQLTIRGGGHGAKNNGVPGDLLVLIEEVAHPELKRDGNNLMYTKVISVIDAILGAEAEIPTGDTVRLCSKAEGERTSFCQWRRYRRSLCQIHRMDSEETVQGRERNSGKAAVKRFLQTGSEQGGQELFRQVERHVLKILCGYSQKVLDIRKLFIPLQSQNKSNLLRRV